MDDKNKPVSEFEKLLNADPNVNLNNIEIVEENIELPKTNEEVKKETSSPLEEMGLKAKQDLENSVVKPVDNPKYINENQPPVVEEKKEKEINITLNENDLTIGTIKPDTQKSPMAMVVLFTILALFMIFMPTVLEFANSILGTNFQTYSGVEVPEEQVSEEEGQVSKMYPLSKDSIISFDNIEVSNFTMSNNGGYKVSLSIKNKGTQVYKFNGKVYLEYYDDTETFIGRSYFEDVKEITGGMTNSYTVDVTSDIYSKATKIELVQRSTDSYPNVELTNNQLSCSKDTDTIIYTFESSKLTMIKEVYTYNRVENNEDYSEILLNNKSRVSSLDRYDGVTAVLTETEDGFITSILIDYSNASYEQISSNKNYYIKGTYAKNISFEMNAKGYTCR